MCLSYRHKEPMMSDVATPPADTTIAPPAAPPATPPAAAAPAAQAPAAAAPATPPASESLLPPLTPPAKTEPAAGDVPAWAAKVPEKFHVKGTDGKVDAEATLLKQAESYTSLEKLKGNVAPAKPSDYTFTPPEEFKDLKLDDAMSANFRERAHAKGLSQEQYAFVMGEYISLVPEVLNSVVQASAAEARAELSKVWQSPAVFEAQINNASRAISNLPADIQQEVHARFGRDPLFLRAAAAFGQEQREDRSPQNPDGGTGAATIEAIMKDPAYRNPRDPRHAEVSARAQAFFKRQSGEGAAT
jgi:hypothetical protein